RALQLVYVNGRSDNMVTDEKKHAEATRLRAHGITHQMLEFDGGHRLDDDVLMKLARVGRRD
ncbi:MAG: hypothetical protein ACREN5_03935, partial [Gemmatimonadales bacterium]